MRRTRCGRGGAINMFGSGLAVSFTKLLSTAWTSSLPRNGVRELKRRSSLTPSMNSCAISKMTRRNRREVIDAIDEFLCNFENDAKKSPGLSSLRGNGEQLAFRPSDSPMMWSITFDEDGFQVR